MSFSDEVLMAYADGELDAPLRAQIEEGTARDPELARRVRALQTLRNRVRSGFDPILNEPIPSRLIEATRTVVPLRRKPLVGRAWPLWAALAASFVLGAVLWRFAGPGTASPWIVQGEGGLRAGGTLASALMTQLASTQDSKDEVQIGITFESKTGSYCRTFTLRQAVGAAGLACREGDAWMIEVLAQGSGPPSGQYRQAASAAPQSVLEAAQNLIQGEPLDAAAEAAAKARRWQAR
jgi:hypothetical protein